MKKLVQEMIKTYKLKELKCDFMGYTFKNTKDLSFHHLIIPKKDCKSLGIGNGILKWNCALLNADTSHRYLHVIQRNDLEVFNCITNIMIYENINDKIDIASLKKIRDLLLYFEKEHCSDVNCKNKLLIKDEFINGRCIL